MSSPQEAASASSCRSELPATWEEAFDGLASFLVERIDIESSSLLLKLLDNKVITNDQNRFLENFKGDQQTKKLLVILRKRDDRLLPAFCRALVDTGQAHIAERLGYRGVVVAHDLVSSHMIDEEQMAKIFTDVMTAAKSCKPAVASLVRQYNKSTVPEERYRLKHRIWKKHKRGLTGSCPARLLSHWVKLMTDYALCDITPDHAAVGRSIIVYCLIMTTEALMKLQQMIDSGHLSWLFSDIYTAFVNTGLMSRLIGGIFHRPASTVVTVILSTEEYERASSLLTSAGEMTEMMESVTEIGSLPLEMSEYVLMKAYMLTLWEILKTGMPKTSIYWVQLSKTLPSKKAEPFIILSSVSSDWWQTLVGWPQSSTRRWVRHQIQKRLSGLQKYILENMNETPQMSHSELTDLTVIGHGGFGAVYRAKHAVFDTVAYKELDDRICDELKKETRLFTLYHINIVALLAIICEIGHYGVVMEYVLHGALRDFVHKYEVDWPLKLSLAHGIVCGMNYLHSRHPPVIHSDLKTENILVSDTFVAKICDFGLAMWKQQSATQTTAGHRRGTIALMAPEVLKDPEMPRTTEYDVYGFGILLWELLSGRRPFEEEVNAEQMEAMVLKGGRPPLDAIKGPAVLVSFATRWIPLCWHESPDKRPTFDYLEKLFIDITQVQAANPVVRPYLREPKYIWTLETRDLTTVRRHPLPRLLQSGSTSLTAERSDAVCGVTYLDNIMYVVCGWSSTIRLYNTDLQSPLNVINVDGMNNPFDMVVCRDDRQLYIADWPRCIWRVSVDDQSYVKWLTTDESFHCYSLSLTSRRLLVTSLRPPALHQYNVTDRQLLRVVSLPQYMRELYRGVETTRGTFVVGYWGTAEDKLQWAVSEVDVNGRVLQSFTDVWRPRHLSVDSEGRVLVADWGRHRILLLSSELQLQRVLIDTNSQLKLWCPKLLCYSELTSQLYVAHSSVEWSWSSNIISVFHLR